MPTLNTEMQNDLACGLDLKRPAEILSILHSGQVAAAASVEDAIPKICEAAACLANTLSSGGKLAYAAAGSSGLMALADGLELPGTFGIPPGRIAILLAGGSESLKDMKGGPEDDALQAAQDVQSAGLGEGDCVIGLSASGTTPYAVSALQTAKQLGALTIAIANNDSTALLDCANVPVLLQTPPEIIAGSTRMGAATAQKITLNMMSTLMAVHLGHVHDGHMVNVFADNIKLKKRAQGIVTSVAGCNTQEAGDFLQQAGGSVKTAILLCAGAGDARSAEKLLESSGQRLRPALSKIGGASGS